MTPPAAASLDDLVRALDTELRTADIADYSGAHNGLQCANSGTIARIATAVDASLETVLAASSTRNTLLLVHHGLFWSSAPAITGTRYTKYRALLTNDCALYSSHLPLDLHATLGNNHLLAQRLGLTVSGGFARFQQHHIGVRGTVHERDMPASALVADLERALAGDGGVVRASLPPANRVVHQWAICTGGGASSETIHEARTVGIDTLIVGEGPHHTTVNAREEELLILYAGHYATETFGVRALGEWLSATSGLPVEHLHFPTGS